MRFSHSIRSVGYAFALLILARPAPGRPAMQAPDPDAWRVYGSCTLEPGKFSDGDSFYVRVGDSVTIYRLYFVDCPETNMQIPSRVSEQGEYWSLTLPDVIEGGKAATEFTRKYLEQPFTVYTVKQNARGNSKQPRYFAMVKTSRGFLCEALVKAGLARVYGARKTLPDGTDAMQHVKNLDALEARARRARTGLWARSGDPPAGPGAAATGDAESLTLLRSASFYSTDKPPRFLGILPKGQSIEVVEATESNLVRVRAQYKDRLQEGFCRRVDLERSGLRRNDSQGKD